MLALQEEIVTMAQILVRGLEDKVVELLKARAEKAGRSMEAEVRTILRDTIGDISQIEKARQFADVSARFRAKTAKLLSANNIKQDDGTIIFRRMRDERTAHQASLLKK
jgi:antitoxin FitA